MLGIVWYDVLVVVVLVVVVLVVEDARTGQTSMVCGRGGGSDCVGRSRSSSSSSGAIGYDRDAGNGRRRTVTGGVDWVK